MLNFSISLSATVAAISIGATVVNADFSPYQIDSYGNYLKDNNSNCIRTGNWSKDNPIEKCGDQMPKPEPVAEVTPLPVPAPVDEPVVLTGSAVFKSGSSFLTPEGKTELEKMATELEFADIASIQVIGHADSSGPEKFNQELSEKRAAAVSDALLADGVIPQSLESRGMGETQPIADNSTPEGRAKNRRVEININALKNND